MKDKLERMWKEAIVATISSTILAGGSEENH